VAERRSASERRRVDRRVRRDTVAVERRSGLERRAEPERRRNINQYDMEPDALELINAVNRFKERTGKPFPTWSEVLGILRSLGYEKRG
jgi:hypothetical protein